MLKSESFAARMRSPHVLLADDDDDFSALLKDALDDRGYRVTRVADGASLRDALSISKTGDATAHYDMVLTDVRMPKVNGLEALRNIPSEQLPPVVLMTAFGSAETHETAYQLGVKLVIDKPFDLLDFCTVVECLVGPAAPTPFQPLEPSLRSLDELCCGKGEESAPPKPRFGN